LTLDRFGGRDLGPVLARERHVGESLVARSVHHRGEFLELLAQGIGDIPPLPPRCFLRFLDEDRLQHGGYGGRCFGPTWASALRNQ
jgi:hypothetical protein